MYSASELLISRLLESRLVVPRFVEPKLLISRLLEPVFALLKAEVLTIFSAKVSVEFNGDTGNS